MKRFFALLLALLLLLPACAPDAGDSDARTLKRIGKALSLDLSAGTLERLENTHGGFHGDGRTAGGRPRLAAPAPIGEHGPGPAPVRHGHAAGGRLLLPL